MYNAENYLLEKQAQRPSSPLSRAEMTHIYGRAQKHRSSWGKRLGAALSTVRRRLKAPAQATPNMA